MGVLTCWERGVRWRESAALYGPRPLHPHPPSSSSPVLLGPAQNRRDLPACPSDGVSMRGG